MDKKYLASSVFMDLRISEGVRRLLIDYFS